MASSAPAIDSWTDAADPTRRIGRTIDYVPVIGSTNDRARARLTDPDGDGWVVVADLQRAGRGRHGRSWQSPGGRNLTVSIGVRPRLSAADAWFVSAASALAVLDATRPHGRLSVKWPNDLVAGDGRKVAGILVETSLDGERLRDAVIGIGVNVNWRRDEMPPELAAGATSLADLSGRPVARVELLRALLDRLDAELAAIEAGSSPLERYRSACVTVGCEVEVEAPGGRIEGPAVAIDDRGGLVVETADGPVTVTSGDVIRVRAGAGS